MKNIKTLLLFLAFGILSISELQALHKYYVGITEIDHNAKAKSLEIMVKLFTDDLQKALEAYGYSEQFYLGETNENINSNVAIEAYLRRNFEIEVNGKLVEWSFLGKQTDLEACMSFLEVKNIKKVKSIEISNKCLSEIYSQQTHLIHVSANNQKQSVLLTATKTEDSFDF